MDAETTRIGQKTSPASMSVSLNALWDLAFRVNFPEREPCVEFGRCWDHLTHFLHMAQPVGYRDGAPQLPEGYTSRRRRSVIKKVNTWLWEFKGQVTRFQTLTKLGVFDRETKPCMSCSTNNCARLCSSTNEIQISMDQSGVVQISMDQSGVVTVGLFSLSK